MSVGIMQGRLCPPEHARLPYFPRAGWRDEFARAESAGLEAIEWIWDTWGGNVNPLASPEGVAELKSLSDQHGVAVRSVCANYFMEYPLVRTEGREFEARQAALVWLIGRCAEAGVGRIILPFLDQSKLETAADRAQAIRAVTAALASAEPAGVELHLETSLAPRDFANLLDELPHPLVQVNYDSGNSASLGYHPAAEFAAYGERIGGVHIKDRILGGATVPLGTGDADFPGLSKALRDVGYAGDFILEAARGVPGDETAWSRANRRFVETQILSDPPQ
jgi:hexulose-6-phosphate isomerase